MYGERYALPFLAGVLLASAERRRPGLGPWNPKVREDLETSFKAELLDLRRGFFELFDDPAYWDKVEKTLLEVCFTRYCAVAERQTALELGHYRVWRGGDIVARATYAFAGLLIGILMVKIPFIPIPTEWDLFALATMVGAPFIPEVQVALAKGRYKSALKAIVADMKAAEEQLQLYQPIMRPMIDAPQPSEDRAAQKGRQKE